MTSTESTTQYRTGNHEPIPEGEVVFLKPGEKPWAFDADGNEIREGDHVVALPGAAGTDGFGADWVGAIARVAGIGHRDGVYETSGKPVRDAYWPGSKSAISVTRVTYPANSSWAIPGEHLRRVDLTSEDGLRLLLSDKLAQRGRIDGEAARIEGDRVRLSSEIRRLREDLGEV